jgi:hypothetical protein
MLPKTTFGGFDVPSLPRDTFVRPASHNAGNPPKSNIQTTEFRSSWCFSRSTPTENRKGERMTTVFNLATQKSVQYDCAPRQAVIAAYAQEKGDYSTWAYEQKYGPLVEAGEHIFLCGDWSALKVNQTSAAPVPAQLGLFSQTDTADSLYRINLLALRDRITERLLRIAKWEIGEQPKSQPEENAMRTQGWLSPRLSEQGLFENHALGVIWAHPVGRQDLYSLNADSRPWEMVEDEYSRALPLVAGHLQAFVPACDSATGKCLCGQAAEVYLAVEAGIAVSDAARQRFPEAVTAALASRERMRVKVKTDLEVMVA